MVKWKGLENGSFLKLKLLNKKRGRNESASFFVLVFNN